MSDEKPKTKCYVVQPWGDPGTPSWLRARRVLKEFIEPACLHAGYVTESFHHDLTTDLVAVNQYHLQRAPMVIADLGRPPWNENVMMEVGYRFVSKKPIVLIRDTPDPDAREELPFLLRPYRVIQLPPDGTEMDSELRNELKQIAVNNIKMLILSQQQDYTSWNSSHAMAVLEIECLEDDKEGTTVETTRMLEANVRAQRLFGKEDNSVLGVPGEEITESVLSWIPERQIKPFEDDQTRIYEALFTGDTNVISEVPLVFSEEHPVDEYRNKAFKPIIIQNEVFQHDSRRQKFYVRMLYLDVTHSVWKDSHGEYHYAESPKTTTSVDRGFPCCVVEFDFAKAENGSRLLKVNELAEEMLQSDKKDLVGKKGDDVAEMVSDWMPPGHGEAFFENQKEIYQQLRNGARDVQSERPMVFSEAHPDPRFRGKAFRPIVFDYKDVELPYGLKRLHVCVLFLDVSGEKICKKYDGQFHYADCKCSICQPEPPEPAPISAKLGAMFYYHPLDKDAESVFEKLKHEVSDVGMAWFDREDLLAADSGCDEEGAAQIGSVLERTNSVVVLLGNLPNRNRWDQRHIKPLIKTCKRRKIAVILVVARGASPPDFPEANKCTIVEAPEVGGESAGEDEPYDNEALLGIQKAIKASRRRDPDRGAGAEKQPRKAEARDKPAKKDKP